MRIFEPSKVNAFGYILVGGYSSRFGRDKAFVELNGVSMIERMKAVLYGMFIPQIWLVGDPGKYSATGIPCIPDRWPGEGPLGGILTALINTETFRKPRTALFMTKENTATKRNFILSCDMPFLNERWMEEFLCRSFESDADVILPKSDAGLEPLCACWRTSARPAIEKQFNLGVRKVTSVLEHLKTEVLDEADWKRFDSAGRLFWNMNTAADYEEARKIVEAG